MVNGYHGRSTIDTALDCSRVNHFFTVQAAFFLAHGLSGIVSVDEQPIIQTERHRKHKAILLLLCSGALW